MCFLGLTGGFVWQIRRWSWLRGPVRNFGFVGLRCVPLQHHLQFTESECPFHRRLGFEFAARNVRHARPLSINRRSGNLFKFYWHRFIIKNCARLEWIKGITQSFWLNSENHWEDDWYHPITWKGKTNNGSPGEQLNWIIRQNWSIGLVPTT